MHFLRSTISSVVCWAVLLFPLTAAAQPQLSVRIDGQEISSNYEHDFGTRAVNSNFVQVVVVLRNTGNQDLVFSQDPPVPLAGGFPEQFQIVQPALETGSKLSPNGSTAFAVKFVPTIVFPNLNTTSFIFTNASGAPFSIKYRGASILDCNMNGVADSEDITSGTSTDCDSSDVPDECETLTDDDGDGTPNVCEVCSADPDKTEPGLCGCGVPDTDPNGDLGGDADCNFSRVPDRCENLPDDDADGTPNVCEVCVADPDKTEPGLCGCGVPDLDSDGDGTLDCDGDLCPDDANKVAPLVCGCGVEDTDTDTDGVADCIDKCPEDDQKELPGQCGCGESDVDTDGDFLSDCLDLCPNNPNKYTPGVCGCEVSDDDLNGNGVIDCQQSLDFIASLRNLKGIFKGLLGGTTVSSLARDQSLAANLLGTLSKDLRSVKVENTGVFSRLLNRVSVLSDRAFSGKQKKRRKLSKKAIRLTKKLLGLIE